MFHVPPHRTGPQFAGQGSSRLRFAARRTFHAETDTDGFRAPAILLGGPVDYDMYKDFRTQLDRSPKEGLVVTELSTLGGDPEVARMMGETFASIARIRSAGDLSSWERPRSIQRGQPS
jgi:hypothetical protein